MKSIFGDLSACVTLTEIIGALHTMHFIALATEFWLSSKLN